MNGNFISKKAISRRTILRAAGAAIALPLLDSMVPAAVAQNKTAARPVPRFGVVYLGNGASMPSWTPSSEVADYELSQILRPLAPVKSELLVLSGLDNKPAVAQVGDPAGGHGRCSPAFLSGVHVKPTEGADFLAGTSIDQTIAMKLGATTQLRSLEIGLEGTEFAGVCDSGYSCAYTNTVCWRNPTSPMPMENNPRVVFERLFGDGGSASKADRLASLKARRSILDSVGDQISHLQAKIGPADRSKLADFLHSVRETERRIEIAEQQAPGLPAFERPLGVPASLEAHAKLMYDLQVLAYQTDITRVITFMPVRELSPRTYPELGVPDTHHAVSHHRDDPKNLAKLAKINHFHTRLFAYYLERLRATPAGEGSLLDQTVILYGSGMGDSNKHDPHNLPILLVGNCAGRLKTGRHIKYPGGTPLMNLYVTLLNMLGVPTATLGDSNGELRGIVV